MKTDEIQIQFRLTGTVADAMRAVMKAHPGLGVAQLGRAALAWGLREIGDGGKDALRRALAPPPARVRSLRRPYGKRVADPTPVAEPTYSTGVRAPARVWDRLDNYVERLRASGTAPQATRSSVIRGLIEKGLEG